MKHRDIAEPVAWRREDEMNLPNLPEPDEVFREDLGLGDIATYRFHSEAQMQAYGRACYRLAIEEAAKVCDETKTAAGAGYVLMECAAAIRALGATK